MAEEHMMETIHSINRDVTPEKDVQRKNNPEVKQHRPWYKRFSRRKRTKVFIHLHTNDLRGFMNKLKKRIKVNPKDIRLSNGSVNNKKRTIIVIRHGSTRLDSDVKGCCKDISESDIERTIVVIVCGFENNKNDCHGMEISPKTLKAEHEDDKKIENLKGIVEINFKCLKRRTKCKDCKNALKVIKMHAKSPNDK